MRTLLALFASAGFALGQDEPLLLKIDVQVVRVPVAVEDASGRPVTGLKSADFSLTDNSQPQRIGNVWSEDDLPLTIGLVLDVSESQLIVLEQNRGIMREFLRGLLRPQDRVFLVAFTGQARLFHDLTPSGDAVVDVAAKIHTKEQTNGTALGPPCKPIPPPRGQRTLKKPPKTCGGSVIWHALYHSVEKLKSADTRKALVLLTDGQDTGSDRTLAQVIAAAQQAGVTVYPCGVGGNPAMKEGALNELALRQLGEETGGVMFTEKQGAAEIFERINLDLRSQYVIGFSPTVTCDGQFHRLQVTAGDGRKVRTRAGYQASTCATP